MPLPPKLKAPLGDPGLSQEGCCPATYISKGRKTPLCQPCQGLGVDPHAGWCPQGWGRGSAAYSPAPGFQDPHLHPPLADGATSRSKHDEQGTPSRHRGSLSWGLPGGPRQGVVPRESISVVQTSCPNRTPRCGHSPSRRSSRPCSRTWRPGIAGSLAAATEFLAPFPKPTQPGAWEEASRARDPGEPPPTPPPTPRSQPVDMCASPPLTPQDPTSDTGVKLPQVKTEGGWADPLKELLLFPDPRLCLRGPS